MLEQMLGSIQSYVINFWNVKYYSRKVSQELTVPSVYFITPRSFDLPYTKESFENSYTIPINVFHNTTVEAVVKGEEIAQSIRKNGNKIPLLNYDGTETGEHLLVDRVEVREIEDGTALLTIAWKMSFNFN